MDKNVEDEIKKVAEEAILRGIQEIRDKNHGRLIGEYTAKVKIKQKLPDTNKWYRLTNFLAQHVEPNHQFSGFLMFIQSALFGLFAAAIFHYYSNLSEYWNNFLEGVIISTVAAGSYLLIIHFENKGMR